MRVLHCIYDDPHNPWVGGGGALRVRELYRRLASDVEVTVATGQFPGARDEVIDGIRYERLGVARPYVASRLSFGLAATRRLRRGGYDVGLFDFSGYTPIALPRGHPVGLIVHMLHGADAPERWGRTTGAVVAGFERWMLRRTPHVCVTSDWLQTRLEPIVAPSTHFSLVRSGVDDSFFDVERRERDCLLFYGRFDVFQKGLDILIEAFARLRSARPDLRLRLVGRGKDVGRVRTLLREAALDEVVSVLDRPTPEQVRQEMAGALALVHPSRFEGLPMVPAEAMAAGVPVVATDVGAVREVVSPPAGGALVPPGDAAALAAVVEQLLADDDLRHRTSTSARTAAERFRWDRVAIEHMRFLERVAAGA